jgi:hypothetical protein
LIGVTLAAPGCIIGPPGAVIPGAGPAAGADVVFWQPANPMNAASVPIARIDVGVKRFDKRMIKVPSE